VKKQLICERAMEKYNIPQGFIKKCTDQFDNSWLKPIELLKAAVPWEI